MGALGSGPQHKFIFDEKTITNIKKWRTIGLSWGHIAAMLGMKSETPIEKFRKENPEIDLECGKVKLNVQAKFIHNYIKYVNNQMERGENINPQHIQKIFEHFGVSPKESNSVFNAIQVNGGASNGLQVTFVTPQKLQPKNEPFEIEANVIDAETN